MASNIIMKPTIIKEISKSKINNAAIFLNNNNRKSKEKIDEALELVNLWKAIHNYPMNVFKNRLKRVSQKIDKKSLSVQRLKRVSSILKKLKRKYSNNKPTMKLTQMQDIAGCRVVLSNLTLVRDLYNKYYSNGNLKHKKIREKDYITNPKEDGYRSIHIVYKYKSDKKKN